MRKTHGKGVVTIAFDDAYSDTYKYAIRHLDKLKIKATIAVPAGLIGKTLEGRPLIGLETLRKMAESGHEIASHTLTHPNLLRLSRKDKDGVISEIACSKKKLENLLSRKVSSFVFPYIKQNQSRSLQRSAEKYYKSFRITREAPCFNTLPVKNPYNLSGFAIMQKHSLSYINKQIDYAEKNRRWLIEVFHLVGKKNRLSAHRPKPYRFFTHIDDFKRHIDHTLSKNVIVLTQRGAVNRHRG